MRARTVLLTDRRTGEPMATDNGARVVHGYHVERDIPAPNQRVLKQVLAALEVGESFVHTNGAVWSRRLLRDRKFTAKKLAKNRYRIWRIQ